MSIFLVLNKTAILTLGKTCRVAKSCLSSREHKYSAQQPTRLLNGKISLTYTCVLFKYDLEIYIKVSIVFLLLSFCMRGFACACPWVARVHVNKQPRT